MKRIISFIFLSFVLASCNAEFNAPQTCTKSILHASSPEVSRLQLLNGVTTVWNTGDKVSVFYGSTTNECWSYTGNDKATSGDLEYTGEVRFGTSKDIYAIAPYNSGISLKGKAVKGLKIPSRQKYVEGSFSDAVLGAATKDSSLQFHFAQSFVKVNLEGFGELKSVKLKARGGERLAGNVTVSFSTGIPVLTMSAEDPICDSIVLMNDDGSAIASVYGTVKSTLITIPPGTYSDGFELVASDISGRVNTSYYSGGLTLKAGEYISITAKVETESCLTVDFLNSPFTEALPTSGNFQNPDSRNDHTYSTKGSPSYQYFFHGEYKEGSSYGFYLSSTKGLVIGRENSYIRLPKVNDRVVSRIEYKAGSTGGVPYLAATGSEDKPGESTRVSFKGGTTEPGNWYEIISNKTDHDKNYNLVVGGGNLCILELKVYYKRYK